MPFGRVHRVSGSIIDFDSVYQDTNLSKSEATSVVNLFFNEMTDALVPPFDMPNLFIQWKSVFLQKRLFYDQYENFIRLFDIFANSTINLCLVDIICFIDFKPPLAPAIPIWRTY